MAPRVYSACSSDVRNAAHTIVQAFLNDPFNAYFYNLRPRVDGPPPGTEEMMAIHIAKLRLSEWVLLVDDHGRKGAGVALWEPPQCQSLGWWTWLVKNVSSIYESLMGILYYRNTGVNRKVYSRSSWADFRDTGNFEDCRQKPWNVLWERSGRRTRIISIIWPPIHNIKGVGWEAHLCDMSLHRYLFICSHI